jgi:ferredoxin
MTMRVAIDGDRCNGHGRCYDLAPDLFDADDDGRGVVTRADVPPELEDQARRAEGGCPERAVRVEIGAEAARAAREGG